MFQLILHLIRGPLRSRESLILENVALRYVFLMVENSTRRFVHFNVTAHPTMEWTSRQLVEAFPWDTAPTYVLRDRDRIYGRRLRDRPGRIHT